MEQNLVYTITPTDLQKTDVTEAERRKVLIYPDGKTFRNLDFIIRDNLNLFLRLCLILF